MKEENKQEITQIDEENSHKAKFEILEEIVEEESDEEE